ncbi:MAG: pimeloyl-ACP methyl ester esterase BioH [Methylobacter sp.]|uniref:pimeloyl-ACP methyl ester esterase BioH n=1 Tax=Methylobacter sp. TaxID=2051955 RepID=UPI00272FEE3F|nr:pimeloyl-ACP methyl ester esterase BioH [Methylobacter sp.]MDP1665523.1 pimeloyl-ACP methyl ester esterase BioH [Methylobacter sp.]
MANIHLETFGKGKPIVLVHGWAMHTGIWREFAKQLAQNYRVTCIDLPGHGRSGKIDPFTLELISAELVHAVPEQSCCWLGWSLGASVVLDIADRYPERVSSLVLLAGNPLYTQTEQWPGMDVSLLDDFADHLNKNCQATLLRFLSLQVNGLPNRKVLLTALKASVFECDAPDENTLQGGLKILKEADLRRVLSALTIPVSVILGSLDTLVPVAVGQEMQQLLPTLTLNIIDRAGHVPFLSHSRETLAIISRFMDEQCS